MKILLTACGTLCVGLGTLGLFLPLLPTTPFLLLAAFCYARSSKRCHRWLMNNRWFGETLRRYREDRGLSRRHKAAALALLWPAIGYAAATVVAPVWGKVLLGAVALGVTVHLLTIRTHNPERTSRRALPRSGSAGKADGKPGRRPRPVTGTDILKEGITP
jgi:hypothetical protein